jgi:hypothetical protein
MLGALITDSKKERILSPIKVNQIDQFEYSLHFQAGYTELWAGWADSSH